MTGGQERTTGGQESKRWGEEGNECMTGGKDKRS